MMPICACAWSPEDRQRMGLEPAGIRVFQPWSACDSYLTSPGNRPGEGRGSDLKESRGKSRRDRNKCRVYGRAVITKRRLGGGEGNCFVFTNIYGNVALCCVQRVWLYTRRLMGGPDTFRGGEAILGYKNNR